MAVPQALIKDLEGEVSVSRNGEVVAVKAGDFLLPGDEVVTGATGRLALEFAGVEGQTPAAGVMTANGKLSLGEQQGANGQQQIVVLEDGECFEFTTELAENSAAAEGGAMSGLFGAGMLGAGSGSIAGAGALAAGAFLGGGSGDSAGGDAGAGSGTSPSGSNGGSIGVGAGEFSSQDSPQSVEEFVGENLTQENLAESVIEPIQTAAESSQSNPESTPENVETAGEQLSFAGLENVHDALVATTGEGTPQADVVQQLVDGMNQTPVGEPLSPATGPLLETVNTDLGLDTLIAAMPNIDPAEGGLVTSAVDLADGITQPLSQQAEPFDQLIEGLRDMSVEIDHVLDDALSQMTTEVPNLDGGLNTLMEGVLGGADTLQTALNGAGGPDLPEIPEGDLLGTLSSGISSGADALGGAGGLPTLPTDGLTG